MTAKSEKRIEEAITAETTALAQTETDAPKEVSVQDHITVVIPYCKEFAQGRELLLHSVPGSIMYVSVSIS